MATSENPQTVRTFGDGSLDDVPGRFSAHTNLSGDVAEAEHLARYRWVSQLAKGRRVLDAGCGWGYGTAMLADAGASLAAGVDIAPTVIEVAQEELGDRVQLSLGDVSSLPYEDGEFDLVVCFEVIEHLEHRVDVIRELWRVLAPDGVLVISSPNRDRSVPGNPYHVHEYAPQEFREELASVFTNVALYQQHAWVVSALLTSTDAAHAGLDPIPGFTLAKGVEQAPGSEDYMVAFASDARLPDDPRPLGVATADVELRRWLELFAQQDETLRGQRDFIDAFDLDRMKVLAAELERAAAQEASLAARVTELERDLELAAKQHEKLEVAVRTRDELLVRADQVREDIFSSLSWRLTAPLRRLKRD